MNERLRALRKQLGLSQPEFASALGVDASTVSVWEKTGNIPPSKILAICSAYNVSRAWLLAGAGEQFADNDSAASDYSIADRISLIQETLKLTQRQFADAIQHTESTVIGWKKTGNIPRQKLCLICDVFGVSRPWLLDGVGQMFVGSAPRRIDAPSTPREYARRSGCDDVTTRIYERYCALNDMEKYVFSSILEKLVAAVQSNEKSGTNCAVMINGDSNSGSQINY